MQRHYLAIATMALFLIGPPLARPVRADFVKAGAAKAHPAAATRTVTLDLTGMD